MDVGRIIWPVRRFVMRSVSSSQHFRERSPFPRERMAVRKATIFLVDLVKLWRVLLMTTKFPQRLQISIAGTFWRYFPKTRQRRRSSCTCPRDGRRTQRVESPLLRSPGFIRNSMTSSATTSTKGPGDLPNFYVTVDTAAVGEDQIDLNSVDELAAWLNHLEETAAS